MMTETRGTIELRLSREKRWSPDGERLHGEGRVLNGREEDAGLNTSPFGRGRAVGAGDGACIQLDPVK
jgi:hypothetical protein